MVSDFHNDYLTADNAKEIIERYNKSKNLVVGAVFRGERDFLWAKTVCRSYGKYCRSNQFLAFEDFGYDIDLSILFHGLLGVNPLYVGLTWNGENNLAYGCASSGKLKKRGVDVIKELNARGIAVDTAHLCEKSFYGVIDKAESVLCSHTCFYDVNPHVRNLKLDQINRIVDRGGLVGLTLYAPFLTDSDICGVEQVYKQVDYFCQRFGSASLCLGTDFYGCNKFPFGFEDYGFESLMTDYLLSKGYSYRDISRILYENLADFAANRL